MCVSGIRYTTGQEDLKYNRNYYRVERIYSMRKEIKNENIVYGCELIVFLTSPNISLGANRIFYEDFEATDFVEHFAESV